MPSTLKQFKDLNTSVEWFVQHLDFENEEVYNHVIDTVYEMWKDIRYNPVVDTLSFLETCLLVYVCDLLVGDHTVEGFDPETCLSDRESDLLIAYLKEFGSEKSNKLSHRISEEIIRRDKIHFNIPNIQN